MDQAEVPSISEESSLVALIRFLNRWLARTAHLLRRVQALNSTIKAAAYTATEADDLIMVDTSGGNITITLPAAQRSLGHIFYVKKMAAANTMTVACTGSENIDGAATATATVLYTTIAALACRTASPATFGYVIV